MSGRARTWTGQSRFHSLDLSLSNPVIIAFCLTSLMLTVLYVRVWSQLAPLTAVAAGLLSTICASGTLLVLRPVARSCPTPILRTTVVVAGLVLAGGVRFFINVGAANTIQGLAVAESTAARAAIAGLMVALTLPLGVAVVESLAVERRRLTQALQSEQERLRILTESMEGDLAQADADLRAHAHELLAPTMTDIITLLERELTNAEADALSARIATSVDLVVRPVSHRLAATPPDAALAHATGESTSPRLFKDAMDAPRSLRPLWILVTCWIVLLPSPLLLGSSAQGLLITVGESILVALLLLAVRWGWPKRWRMLGIPLGMTVILILILGVQSIFQALLTWSGSEGFVPEWWVSISWLGILPRTVLSMLVVAVGVLLDFGDQRRADLARVNSELTAYLAQLRREKWLMHRSVSLAIHGPVQSAMISTAMRLTNPTRSQTSLKDARQRLELALQEISEVQSTPVNLADRLDDLCSLWHPVVDVSCHLDLEGGSWVHSDPGLQSCVLEVCREAVSNAIRHGGATVVVVHVAEREGRVVVSVIDDGSGVAEDSIAGLGQAALDDICLSWRLENAPHGGAVLTATVV